MKNAVKKSAVILVLVLFLGFTALSAVMYLTSPQPDNIPELIAQCEASGGVRDETTQGCFEDPSTMVSEKELCDEKNGTRYEENQVCITE